MSTKTKEADDMVTVKRFLFALVMFPVNIWLWGMVTLDMYNWFILPVFTMLPALTLLQAIGLRWFVGVLTVTLPRQKDNEHSYTAAETALISTIMALLMWAMSWVLHQW
jgi:hypothetical protein